MTEELSKEANSILQDEIDYWYNKTGSKTTEEIIRRSFSLALGVYNKQTKITCMEITIGQTVYTMIGNQIKKGKVFEAHETQEGDFYVEFKEYKTMLHSKDMFASIDNLINNLKLQFANSEQ